MTSIGERDPTHPVVAFVCAARSRLDDLVEAPLWSLGAADTEALVADLATVEARLVELQARVIGHAEDLHLARERGCKNTTQWVAVTTNLTTAAASRKVKLAQALTSHADTRAALARGAVHVEQATAITGAVDQLDNVDAAERVRIERHYLALAADHDAGELRRIGLAALDVLDPVRADQLEAEALARHEQRARSRTRFSMWEDDQGLAHGRFTLPVAQASMLRKALVALAAPKHVRATAGAGAYHWQSPTPQRLGHALVEYVERFPAEKLPKLGGLSATVVAIGDLAILEGRVKAARLDTGAKISHLEFVRMACDAGIVPAWMDTSTGRVLSLGRKHRLHKEHQRLVLLIERQECEHPGCHTPAWLCHVHHAIAWAEGGHTDTDTAVLLCPFHHHRAHATGATYPLRS